jgi:hypothetical protein
MTSRLFAASIVLLGIGSMISPAETLARSGGFVAAPSLPARGAARPSVSASFFAHTSPRLRMTGEFPGHMRGFRMSRRFDHRQPDFPLWWGYGSYPTDYYPYDYGAPVGEAPYSYSPMENFSERSRPVVTYQPGCRTDTQKVPSESGGERSINITRCY